MFKLLLLVLLIIIIFPILRLIIAIWGATRKFKKQYNDFTSGSDTHYNRGFNHRNTTKKRKKIFSKEVGEYVEFEEIKTNETHTGSTTEKTRETYHESQISDAQFEDIKE